MKKIGRYEIKGQLGDGGMAIVYHAYDPYFEREVAIKVIKAAFSADKSFRERFEREAKVIASLEHPAIVPVYDFGSQNGQLYLVMRLMVGGSLAERLQKAVLSLSQATSLIGHLAPALDMAHQQGIVHRDLKPANILFDQQGNPYIADFGLVKLRQQSALSQTGMLMGTPAFMSPEQARGERNIDRRSDIYALGAVLFTILTGQPPYEADNALGLAYKHIHNPIPSACALRAELPVSCDMVIKRAMGKDREARYATVGEMAAALSGIATSQASPATLMMPKQPFMTVQPPVVPPQQPVVPSQTQRSGLPRGVAPTKQKQKPKRSFWLRKRLSKPLLAAMAILLIVVGAVAINIRPILDILTHSNFTLSTATHTPTQVIVIALSTPTSLPTSLPTSTPTSTAILPTATHTPPPPVLNETPVPQPPVAISAKNAKQVLSIAEWKTGAIYSIDYSPDGKRLAVGILYEDLQYNAVELWSTLEAKPLRRLDGHSGTIEAVAVKDASLMASGSNDGTVRLWQLSDSTEQHKLEHPASVRDIAFNPDKTTLASVTDDGNVYLWHVADGNKIKELPGKSKMISVAFTPDGEILASGSADGEIWLWNASSGSVLQILSGHTSRVNDLTFSPDGTLLASAAADHTIRLWQRSNRQVMRVLEAKDEQNSVAFSPDGSLLASGGADGTIDLWQLSDGKLLYTLLGHKKSVTGVAFHPNGTILASGSHDTTIRLWGVVEP